MSGTVAEEPVTMPEVPEPARSGPDLSKLEDHVPASLRSPRALAGLVFLVGLTYLVFCLRPLWHTDVWGHLAYGRLLWSERVLPVTEPLMPLAKGVSFIDTAWLSQLIGYLAYSKLQIAGLQGLHGIAIAICTAMIANRCYRMTRNGWFSALAVIGFLVLAWGHLAILRPQMAGLACFAVLLSQLTRGRPSRSDWIVVPLLFVAWANLHGSFPVGLLLLACFTAGRAIDVGRRTGSWQAVLGDDRLRQFFLLLELACVAVLVNPYGAALYPAVMEIPRNANLRDLIEWHPLGLNESSGTLFGIAVVGLAVLYRFSPRRVQTWEVLTLVILGWATLCSSRLIVWWAPVAVLLMAIHGHAIWRKWRGQPDTESAPAGKWSVVAAGLAWIFFAYSPLGVRIVHGKAVRDSRAYSSETPLAAAKYLRDKPPVGQIFNTYEWGDYLQWAGPSGLKVFVNSHAHLVPREIWQAYMQISDAQSGWEDALDRYGVNTIVIDQVNRESLIKKLKENDKWKLDFEQDGQVVFLRKAPI